MTTNTALKAAGAALIVCSLAFVAVFTYLANAFGYPDILDRGASEVLPRLLAGGLRNITAAVAVVAQINNVTLPLWLLTLGVLFLRNDRRSRSADEKEAP